MITDTFGITVTAKVKHDDDEDLCEYKELPATVTYTWIHDRFWGHELNEIESIELDDEKYSELNPTIFKDNEDRATELAWEEINNFDYSEVA